VNQIKFTIESEQLFSNWRNQLRQANLYSRHIMISWLRHD